MSAKKIGNFFQNQKVQDKISKQHKIITIGVMGSSFGVGTTHLCLMLGTYFSKNRSKAALVEWGNQTSFSMIEEAYEGSLKLTTEPYFTMRKVAYYKSFSEGSCVSLKDGSYQVIVIDYGEFATTKLAAFNEMDVRLIVGHSNEWKYKELERLFDRVERDVCRRWKVVVPFGTKEEVNLLSASLHNKIISIGFYKDPFIYSKELGKEIELILNV